MDDPCTRKSTAPRPVLAPVKSSSLEINKKDENSLEKCYSILHEDLNLSDKEETQTSVQTLLDILVEEATAKETTNQEDKLLSIKKIISKEFVSSSDEEDKVDGKTSFKKRKIIINKDEKNTKQEQIEKKKSILIPAVTKNQCRYIFVKRPKKGERCTNLTNGQFCIIHIKNHDKKTEQKSYQKVENIRDLELNAQELNAKVEHILNELNSKKKNNNEDLEKKLGDLESKIEDLKTMIKKNEQQSRSAANKFKTNLIPKKLHKLNKNFVYQYIGSDHSGLAEFETNGKTFVVKLPQSFSKQQLQENINNKFKFDKRENLFKFIMN